MPTEAKEIFEAHSRSLVELLSDNGLGLYLPPYQRPYSWDKGKVAKLIDDTLHGLENLGESPDSFTFLGTVITIHDTNYSTVDPVVKEEVPGRVLTVIDGQQRISTLLMLIVCIHNLIRQQHWRVFKGKTPDVDERARASLNNESIELLALMGTSFYEKKPTGASPIYPRLIRAFDDQWSKTEQNARYESPIAYLLFEYAKLVDSEQAAGGTSRPTDFKPKVRTASKEGESDLIQRFNEMRTILNVLAKGRAPQNFEGLPPLATLANRPNFQSSLFGHPLNDDLARWIGEIEEGPEAELIRTLMVASYVLRRIAITMVRGKNENYAFTIFESLNTTGEPLNALETFQPRVVRAEGLQNYRQSKSHEYMSEIQDYLKRFSAGTKQQAATRDLIVSFALAESGKKLSKRLADQRVYLKDTFDPIKDNKEERVAFLRHLRDTACFVGESWDPEKDYRQLPGLEVDAVSDSVKLCLEFLKALNHTIAIGPLVRFYSEARLADEESRERATKDFESAIKAITAFTVLWRSSRRTTGNIDSEYREVLSGINSPTNFSPLARRAGVCPDVEAFKRELVARLKHPEHGHLPNLQSYIAAASSVPIYTVSKAVTRFLLLSAYHDSVEDPENPGLILTGKSGSAPCLSADGWQDETHLHIEHIAPQSKSGEWDPNFYVEERVHRIGNLVLIAQSANSSLGARRWEEKRVLYSALGASTSEEARSILCSAEARDMNFAQSTTNLVSLASYSPHLKSLGARVSDPYTIDFANDRGRNLLELAFRRLGPWLGLDWSESPDDDVDMPRVDELDFEVEEETSLELGD